MSTESEAETVYIGTRVSQDIKKMVETVCKRRRETEANFVRNSILTKLADLGFLNDEDKKALGIKEI